MLILRTFYKNVIFETISFFSNCVNIYIFWFCSITLPLKELDLHLPECMISSNHQIGQILSREKPFISSSIKLIYTWILNIFIYEYWIYEYNSSVVSRGSLGYRYHVWKWLTVDNMFSYLIMFENGWQWTSYVFFTMDNIYFLYNGQHMFSYLKLSLGLNVETWVFNRKYQCMEMYIF